LFAHLTDRHGWIFFRYDNSGKQWFCLTCSSSKKCCHWHTFPFSDDSAAHESQFSSSAPADVDRADALEAEIANITDEHGMLKVTSHSVQTFPQYSIEQKSMLLHRKNWVQQRISSCFADRQFASTDEFNRFIWMRNSSPIGESDSRLLVLRPASSQCKCEQAEGIPLSSEGTLLCDGFFVDVLCISLQCTRCQHITRCAFVFVKTTLELSLFLTFCVN
jgi:hypothetical protein